MIKSLRYESVPNKPENRSLLQIYDGIIKFTGGRVLIICTAACLIILFLALTIDHFAVRKAAKNLMKAE